MKKLRVAVGLFLVATLPACGKASAKARASASTEQSARSAPPKADPPLAVGEDVAAMFGHEARYRPPGTVRVETALEAFRRAGIDVS
ncbi:MAG TPA: hypothetical protein VF103_11815, partial [Polyangiaceae bacterium]